MYGQLVLIFRHARSSGTGRRRKPLDLAWPGVVGAVFALPLVFIVIIGKQCHIWRYFVSCKAVHDIYGAVNK